MVYYLNDDGEATKVRAVGEEHDATDFDVPPFGGVDLDFGHLVSLSKYLVNTRPVSTAAGMALTRCSAVQRKSR